MNSLSGRDQGNLDVKMYEDFFKDIKDGICIECGALDGINLSVCRFFEVNLNWKCINIEPSPISFKQLEVNRPKSINLNFALYDKTEKKFFGENVNRPKKSCLVSGGNTRGAVETQCFTYEYLVNDILIPKYGIDHIDLFVLDVEGSEMQVIEGMRGAKIMPSILCSEVSHCKEDIVNEMLENLPEYKLIFNMRYNYVFKRGGA